MIHTKKYLDEKYAVPDPWGYQDSKKDMVRKVKILKACPRSLRALDIGAGEGWITKDLPARFKYGLEIADPARERMDEEVIPLKELLGVGGFDLVLLSGVLYDHYDLMAIVAAARTAADPGAAIVTCNILKHERLPYPPFGLKEYEETFAYGDEQEHLVRWRT